MQSAIKTSPWLSEELGLQPWTFSIRNLLWLTLGTALAIRFEPSCRALASSEPTSLKLAGALLVAMFFGACFAFTITGCLSAERQRGSLSMPGEWLLLVKVVGLLLLSLLVAIRPILALNFTELFSAVFAIKSLASFVAARKFRGSLGWFTIFQSQMVCQLSLAILLVLVNAVFSEALEHSLKMFIAPVLLFPLFASSLIWAVTLLYTTTSEESENSLPFRRHRWGLCATFIWIVLAIFLNSQQVFTHIAD